MSGMQEASGPQECNYAQLADSITPEANDQDRAAWVSGPGCYDGLGFGSAPRDAMVWIVQHPASRGERNGAETNKQIKSCRKPQVSAPGQQRLSEARSRSIPHKVLRRLPPVKEETACLDAQIRNFKERKDLRECLIPGMVSGISQKACEGWRRQTTAHSSRLMAKIKLGPCKDCKYSSALVSLRCGQSGL